MKIKNNYMPNRQNIVPIEQYAENKSSLKLSDLDVKGREIAGLEPKMEKFSPLTSKDFTLTQKLEGITANLDLESAFIFVNPISGTENRLVEAPHWRTISTKAHAEYAMPNGKTKHYYTFNTKGCGYLKPSLKGGNSLDKYDDWHRTNEYGAEGSYGLAQMSGTFIDDEGIELVDKTKWLTENGLRTELYWGVAELKNVYYKGKLTSIKTLKTKGIIPDEYDYVPSMGVRLLKTNTRIAEITKTDDTARAIELFKNAFETFNQENIDENLGFQELRFGDPKSEETFFKTFFQRMGENLAVFQNLGLIGWGLHSANITMAAEIADIGDCNLWTHYQNLEGREEYIEKYNGVRRGSLKDARDIANGLKDLMKTAAELGMRIHYKEVLVDKFISALESKLDEEKLRSQEYNKEEIISAFRKIFKASIINGKKLQFTKRREENQPYYNIADWNLGFTPDN
jgi:hypothetical protein